MQGSTITNTRMGYSVLPTILADNRGNNRSETLIYADSVLQYDDGSPESVTFCVFQGPENSTVLPSCSYGELLPLSEAGDEFLSSNDTWYRQQQQVANLQNM